MIDFKEHIEQFPYLKTASELANELNIDFYIVGGYVRDILLERDRDEIDFLIVGNGPEFAKMLADRLGVKSINIYKNFGTAHFKYDGIDLEFVGSRKESYDYSSRNPVVTAGTFQEDIDRRDFTINTMVISLNKNSYGKFLDTMNGYQDLLDKIIRTPLNPEETFNDDPLRILRAFRFAAQLQFRVCDDIMTAAEKMSNRLLIVSQERITDEFLKILSSSKPSVGLKLLYKTGVMKVIFPEVANLAGVDQRDDFHHKDVFLHTCQVIDNIAPETNNVWLRLAALLHDIAKPKTKRFVEGTGWTFHGHEELGARMVKGIFKRLKLSFGQIDYVEKLVRLHLRPIALVNDNVSDSAIRRMAAAAGESLDDLITLCRADITSKNSKKVERYLANYEKVMLKVKEVQEKDELRAFQSPVRGDEIMEVCNIKPSKKVGEIKTAIEEAILEGIIGNNYDEAYQYLLKIKNEFVEN